MSVISPIDRKWMRLLRGDALARIISPSEFTSEEWERLAHDVMLPGMVEFARSQEVARSEAEYLERRFFAEAMQPNYVAGVLMGGLPLQDFTNKDTSTSATSGTSIVVDPIAFFYIAKAWAAGSGSGAANGGTSGRGAGGGFITGKVNVAPGETLTKRVGGHGVGGSVTSEATGGGGAGYTGLFRVSTGLPIIIAGAPGGGGYANTGGSTGGNGGFGGGSTGGDGADASSGGTRGSGGTQLAGGSHGTGTKNGTDGGSLTGGNGGGLQHTSGTAGLGGTNGGGNSFTGATASNDQTGGGGGGGYFGGGGGGSALGGGGGGGSSFIDGTGTAVTNTQSSSGTTAAGTGDPDYSGSAGNGGAARAGVGAGNDGNDGRLVLAW